jgi:hypothetical protein
MLQKKLGNFVWILETLLFPQAVLTLQVERLLACLSVLVHA